MLEAAERLRLEGIIQQQTLNVLRLEDMRLPIGSECSLMQWIYLRPLETRKKFITF